MSKIRVGLLNFVYTISVILFGISAAQAGTVVQLTTPLGNFSVELFDDDTPITVTNFLHHYHTDD